jgi:hypothetical protein
VFGFNPDLKDQVRSGWLHVHVCVRSGPRFHCFLDQQNCFVDISNLGKLEFWWLIVGCCCDLAVSESLWLSLKFVGA